MVNLLDLLPEDEKNRAVSRFENRMRRSDRHVKNRVSNEMYIVAEFGYYFGWGGVAAIRNNEISLAEVNALLEGARKVWYAKVIETGRSHQISVASAMSNDPNKSFETGMKPFRKAAEL